MKADPLKAKFSVALSLFMAFLLVSCGGGSSGSSSSDDDTDTVTEADTDTDSSSYSYNADCASLTDQTELVVCLAENLLSTMSDIEIDAMIVDLTEQNATEGWSNLPIGSTNYNGITLGDMSDESKSEAEILADAALSVQGQVTMSDVRAADEYLGEIDGPVYGEDNYAMAFIGEPSTTEPWLLYFGGHHYTFFTSYDSEAVSATPNFVAIEPLSWTSNNTTYEPMARHQQALVAMLEGLTDTELVTAMLVDEYDDVLVGPQSEGNYPDVSEGVSVADLTAAQRVLVADAIRQYSEDSTETGQTENYTSDENLDLTYIAWAGYSDVATQGSYVRIDGPRVWIEFTVQGGVVFSEPHYHSIWRDKEYDYGSNFDL